MTVQVEYSVQELHSMNIIHDAMHISLFLILLIGVVKVDDGDIIADISQARSLNTVGATKIEADKK